MLDDLLLRHNLHWSPGLFLRLGEDLTEGQFYSVMEILERHAGPNRGAKPADHWLALKERVLGRSRWDTVVPVYRGDLRVAEGRKEWGGTVQLASRMSGKRPYSAFERDGILYVLDVFNPANELELDYRGAGEPVLTLQLGETTADPRLVHQSLPIRDKLGEIDSFYRILVDLVRALRPKRLVGGDYLGRVILAYRTPKGRLARTVSPWDLLWTLTAVDRERLSGLTAEEIGRHFWRAISIEGYSSVVLHLVPRFDSVMGAEYIRGARLLGMRSVAEVGG